MLVMKVVTERRLTNVNVRYRLGSGDVRQ